MEVHAHTHTARKKWTHYLWEFVMLFLAVFCGFLAEYQLEHMIEHNKEKEYMTSMIEDLAQDTTEVNRVNAAILVHDKEIDSLLNRLELPISNNKNELQKLYLLHYRNTGAEMALFSQRTISQLKNAGGLRLIRNKSVADSITLYDSRLQYLGAIAKTYDEVTTEMGNQGHTIFDNRYVRNRFNSESISLINNNTSIIRIYSNYVFTVQNVARYYSDFLLRQKKLAIALLHLIKNEYHLK